MLEHNHVEESVEKHIYFAKDMLNAINDYFGEMKDIYFQNEKAIVKVFRDEKNKRIDIIYKSEEDIRLYTKKIYDINENDTTEAMLNYFHKSLQEKKDKLNAQLVIAGKINKINRHKNAMINVKEVNQMLSSPWTEANQKKLKEFRKKYQVKDNPYYERMFKRQKYLSNSTSDIGLLKTYYDFLKHKNYIKSNYSVNFFKLLNEKNVEYYAQYTDEMFIDMKMLLKASQKHNFTEKKRFWYNDSEYAIWQDNGKLMLSDQNCILMVDIEDEKNYIIYLIDNMYSTKDELTLFKERLEKNEINDFTDIALKVENGKITLCNSIGMYITQIDVEFGAKDMMQAKKCKREYPVDMESYEYQKNYFCHQFNKTEFDFLSKVFLDQYIFSYSLKKGLFKSLITNYKHNLPIEKQSIPKYITLNKCYPKKFSYLNNDWLEGLKFFVRVLKEKKPLPLEYGESSAEEALAKAIKYFDKKIATLENKPLIQP